MQPGHPASCLRSPQAGTSCSHSPLSAQPWVAEKDGFHALPARAHTRAHMDIHLHTRTTRIPPPMPPAHVREPGRFFCARFAGPALLLLVFSFLSFISSSFATFLLDPPGWLLPLCPGGALAYSVREERGPWSCALHAQRGPSSGAVGTKGLASGLRPVCFPFAP